MAADANSGVKAPQETPVADPFSEGKPPAPQPHKVARSAPGNDVLNTIDLFGEKSFSV